jgi:hypothetical protein
MTEEPQSSRILDNFAHEQYQVRRKILTVFGAAFHIYDPEGNVAFFSRLKAFKLKEDIRVYTDESERTEALVIQARQILDISAAYDVIDPQTGKKIGALKRKGMKSMFKDEWILLDPADQQIGLIKEDSAIMALLRRTLSNLIPQKFYGELDGHRVCSFKQNFNPFVLKIDLDFSMDEHVRLDRRLGIAAAILLCAIESRQN